MDIKKFMKNYKKRRKKKGKMINNMVIRVDENKIVLNGSEIRRVMTDKKLIDELVDDLLNTVDEDVFRLVATKEE